VGHVVRIEEGKTSKKVVNDQFHNTKSAGKPRKIWEDVFQSDALQVLGVRGWRRQAEYVK
jgi:hypothetical protein